MNPTWISAIEQNVSSVAISRDALGLRFPGHAGLHFGRSIELPRPGSLGSGASVPRDESHIILESLVNELSLRELRRVLRSASDQVRVGGVVTLFLLDPDRFPSDCWPGEQHSIYDRPTRYRPLRQIYEIARLFPCRVRTPRPIAETPVVRVDLERLTDIPHRRDPDPRHRYGRETAYRRFDRLEEPEILDDLVYGLASMKPRPGHRVLSIGVNDARELELFEEVGSRQLELCGVDWNHSAIAAAHCISRSWDLPSPAPLPYTGFMALDSAGNSLPQSLLVPKIAAGIVVRLCTTYIPAEYKHIYIYI